MEKLSEHLLFDVKIDLTRKGRWVLDVNNTPVTIVLTYTGVVPRESVRIDSTNVALNCVNVLAADIWDTYLQYPS